MSESKNHLAFTEDKDTLVPVKDAIQLYNRRNIPYWTLRDTVRQHGEAGYTLAIREMDRCGELTARGGVDQQQWILNDAEKYLNSETVSYIIDMASAKGWGPIEEHSAVVLAKKWDIAETPIKEKIEKLLNEMEQASNLHKIIMNYVPYSVRLERPEFLDLQNKKIHTVMKEFGGKEKLENLTTTLGLAFFLYEDEPHRKQIIKLFTKLADVQEFKGEIGYGLKRAYKLSKGKSPYYWYYRRIPESESNGFPYNLEFPKNLKKSQKELSQIFEILTGTFITGEIENTKETTGKRNIIEATYLDPNTGRMVSTIIKVCNKDRAIREKNNFELLASWGCPVPQVYELHKNGIRVEDLTDGARNQLIMDEFRGFGMMLDVVENGKALKEELDHYWGILENNGVDIKKLERVLGLVFDPHTRKGSLFFVDVDHIIL